MGLYGIMGLSKGHTPFSPPPGSIMLGILCSILWRRIVIQSFSLPLFLKKEKLFVSELQVAHRNGEAQKGFP